MHVVIVFFDVKREHLVAFRTAVLVNARLSLDREPGCRVFDVAQDPIETASFFLYEVYDDRAAFNRHLEMPHYAEFATAVEPWVVSKRVLTYELISDQGQA